MNCDLYKDQAWDQAKNVGRIEGMYGRLGPTSRVCSVYPCNPSPTRHLAYTTYPVLLCAEHSVYTDISAQSEAYLHGRPQVLHSRVSCVRDLGMSRLNKASFVSQVPSAHTLMHMQTQTQTQMNQALFIIMFASTDELPCACHPFFWLLSR